MSNPLKAIFISTLIKIKYELYFISTKVDPVILLKFLT